MNRRESISSSRFQPTRPLRGATEEMAQKRSGSLISTHAPLAGRDITTRLAVDGETGYFNPRAPCGARRIVQALPQTASYFNPRAPCGARPMAALPFTRIVYFNPRAPCGARLGYLTREQTHDEFQPTRPLRGATSTTLRSRSKNCISTHAPLAGRDYVSWCWDSSYCFISTHAPLAGRDDCKLTILTRRNKISTHAPLAGRDCESGEPLSHRKYFNPRAPCGARRHKSTLTIKQTPFQPTRPLRGAT